MKCSSFIIWFTWAGRGISFFPSFPCRINFQSCFHLRASCLRDQCVKPLCHLPSSCRCARFLTKLRVWFSSSIPFPLRPPPCFLGNAREMVGPKTSVGLPPPSAPSSGHAPSSSPHPPFMLPTPLTPHRPPPPPLSPPRSQPPSNQHFLTLLVRPCSLAAFFSLSEHLFPFAACSRWRFFFFFTRCHLL